MAKGKQHSSIDDLMEDVLISESKWPYKVPGNWEWVKLGSLAKIISKGTTPKGGKDSYLDSGIKFLRIENIDDNGLIDLSNIKYIDKETHYGYLKRSILEAGDILISIAGTLGRTTIVKNEYLPLNTNQALAFIRLESKLQEYNQYIEKVLSSPAINNRLLQNTKVTSIPNLTLEIISNCYIPLPPLAEQQRIVELIENLFEKLDKAKELIQDVLDSFENRKSAILHKAFSGELTKKWREENGVGIESWEEIEINRIGNVKGGKRLPKGETLTDKNTGFPYIKAGDLKYGTVILDKIQYVTPEIQSKIKNYTVSAGDVYITIVGACIGDVGVIPEVLMGANLTENAAKITDLKCNSKYLGICMSTSIIQKQIKNKIASATLGKLSLQNIKSLIVPLPSLLEQQEIVRILDNLFEKEQTAKELCDLIDSIELMKKSILARAFRGELGTNNPEEESAIGLLKQILSN